MLTVRYVFKINGGNPWGGIWFSPILHTCCPLFLGLFFFSLEWGGYFVIYFISCPIKSLPFSHGQSTLMSASFLYIERIIFRQNKAWQNWHWPL